MFRLSIPFATSILLFAETATDPMGAWGQLTALSIVAIVLIFIVTRMLPSIHEQFVKQSQTFAESMARVQGEFAKTADDIAKRQHEDSAELNKSVMALREHCAAARAALEGRPHE